MNLGVVYLGGNGDPVRNCADAGRASARYCADAGRASLPVRVRTCLPRRRRRQAQTGAQCQDGLSADQAGLTLLEVLVATVLLGLVLVAVFGLFITGTRMEGAAGKHMEALRLAETKLEEYKAKDYEGVEVGITTGVVATGPQFGGIYTKGIEVTETIGVIATGVKTKMVTVTVSWPEYGQTETVSLTMERVER